MAITYTWKIPNVIRELTDGGIIEIYWECTGVDGNYFSSKSGTTSHTPKPSDSNFIKYDDVTEANCISWVQSVVGKDTIESKVASGINDKKEVTTGTGKPWD